MMSWDQMLELNIKEGGPFDFGSLGHMDFLDLWSSSVLVSLGPVILGHDSTPSPRGGLLFPDRVRPKRSWGKGKVNQDGRS